jgi:hypothetical protein
MDFHTKNCLDKRWGERERERGRERERETGDCNLKDNASEPRQ